MKKQLKHLYAQIKAVGEEGNGRLTGCANAFNVRDSYNDVTMPGAFADTLAELESKGYLLADHEWSFAEGVIGMITRAYEDATGLQIEAEFHGDPTSQRVRQIVKERLAQGKEVGLSIGYWVDECEVGDWQGEQATLLRKVRVKEVSVVVAQANDASAVTSVKGAGREEELEALLAQADAYLERVQSINDLGRSDAWRQARAGELDIVMSKLTQVAEALRPKTEPLADQREIEKARRLVAAALTGYQLSEAK